MGLKEQVIKEMILECVRPLLDLQKKFEKQGNRVDEITEDTSAEKYPSVSAVINFVKAKNEALSEAFGKAYLKITDFDSYKKSAADSYATKTDVEDLEKTASDTYATKTDVEDFEKNVVETCATKTDVEDFENNVAETYATKTDVEDFENNVAETYATKTDVEDLKTDTEVTATATGSAITIESSQAPLQNLKLFGKTEQDGIPTPDNPIELKSVGDSGSFEVGVYGKNLLGLDETTIGASYGVTFTINAKEGYIEANGTATDISYVVISRKTINLPEGSYVLSGCANGGGVNTYALASNGNVNLIDHGDGSKVGVVTKTNKINNIVFIVYKGTTVNNLRVYPMLRLANITDSTFEPCNKQALIINDTLRGIGDIKDEVDFNRGVKIQRIQNAIPSNFNLAKYSLDVGNGYFGAYITTGTGYPAKTCVGISSHFPMLTWNDIGKKAGVFIGNYVTPTHIFVPETIASDVATLKQWLIDNDVKIYYPLKEPIETPISESELNAYRQLMTNEGATTILSEAEAEVDYYINKPNAQAIGNIHSQLNKDYFKLQQAIIETGGN